MTRPIKEGWDVRNVTTIVGLRPYASKSNILPEQTLGRGLRRMYFGKDARETVSVMGTPAFMDFVESIQSEGVTFERVPMGAGAPGGRDSLVVEVETGNPDKDLEALDIPIPRLARRFHRDFKDLEALDPASLGNARLPLKPFTQEETRQVVFKLMLDEEIHHTVRLDGSGPADYRSVVAFFARQLLKELRLVGGYDVLYGKVKAFLREHLFDRSPVDLEDPVLLRNLSEPEVGKLLFGSFKTAINSLTIQESGTTRIEDWIRLRDTRPFRIDRRPYLAATKSVFNRIVGEAHSGGFELSFAAFLEGAPDVGAFSKNYLAVGFKLDYVRADGDLSNYTPDFIVRTTDGIVWIVETKGMQEIDVPQKMARLRQWCVDATTAGAPQGGTTYRFAFVDQNGFERHTPKTMAALAASFTEHQA
jgi:type III restriction enzyme